MKQRQLFEVTRIDWETPQALFDELDAEFGFVLDVCATDENAKCENYFTSAVDGLRQPWSDYVVCWMNPPYGREIAAWVRKAAEEAEYGALVVGLVPARTDTAWWHESIIGKHAEVRFLRGRISFSGGGPAPFPSAVIIWRPTDGADEAPYCWCGHSEASHAPLFCIGCSLDADEDADPQHPFEEPDATP